MTTKELRIAKLSKVLNSSVTDKNSNSPVIKDAYSRAYHHMQKIIDDERALNFENEERDRLKAKIEEQDDQIKENMKKHHFSVLKNQIEYRRNQRDLNVVEKLLERPKASPQTPPDPPKFSHRENLKNQIKAKKKITKEHQKNELDMDRFFLRVANSSLEDDISRKKNEKEKIFSELKESWENTIALNQMRKQAEKLQFYGNLSVYKNTKPALPFQRSKSKDSPEKESKNMSKTCMTSGGENRLGKSIEVSPLRPIRENFKNMNKGKVKGEENKVENLMYKSYVSSDKKDVEKRLEEISREEERIKTGKKEIFEYLTSRNQSKRER